MERLNGLDAGLLYAETTAWHMHAGAVFVIEHPGTDPEQMLVDLLRARMPLLTPLHRRLVETPLHLGMPAWIADPDVDVEAHVQRVGVPSPGGSRELAELAGHLFSTKLDRDRPPWEFWVIEGLEDERVALLLKIHHALLDGVRAARFYEVLFDLERDAPLHRPTASPVVREAPPSAVHMLADAVRFAIGTVGRAARFSESVSAAIANLAGIVVSSERQTMTWPFVAPRTSFNKRLTARRSIAFASVPLADVRIVKAAFGVTVNDVALAMCAGGLRRYLEDRGELPGRSLVAQIPVGVHRADPVAAGNFVAPTGAKLHTEIGDPAERLRAIAASTRSAKDVQAALGDDFVIRALEMVPPPVLTAGVHMYQSLGLAELHPPIFNLIVSNVVGPPVPLFCGSGRLVASYLLGPLLLGCGLNITFASYLDRIDFGIVTCPDVVDDPWAIADALPDALEELLRAALEATDAGGTPRPDFRASGP
ncbi:MAG: WS/DGAT/MGAT family O-acyltransferase [Acidimicrobiia bacterium]